jgi:hypothetical protein
MNRSYKIFVLFFLSIQTLVIFKLFPKNILYNSYAAEVVSQIFFSISKVNRLYNFFTHPSSTGGYTYTSNNIFMLKQQGDSLEKLPISVQGSIKRAVNPVNAARINHLQALAMSDTLLYNAVVRSEALYYFKEKPSYPLFYIEVLNHRCSVRKDNSRFIKEEQVDTVYYNYFSVD